jgi:hypothetical protein
MTRFEFEPSELARFDRRLLADVGLVGGEGPHPSQLRKVPAKRSMLAIIVDALAARAGLSVPAAR